MDALRGAIEKIGTPKFGSTTATEFHLYQSVLKPGGAEYTRLATFSLSGSITQVNFEMSTTAATLWGLVVLGYFLGSIPFGYLLVRAKGGGDIRQIGSGNIGATNVARTSGWAVGCCDSSAGRGERRGSRVDCRTFFRAAASAS